MSTAVVNAEPTRASAEPPARLEASGRLMSLDALRGFDMFWIVGGEAIARALDKMSGGPVTSFVAGQLKHTQWAGFTCYDLIFPMFLFMVGAAMVFSLDKTHGSGKAILRVVRRSVVLYLLGVIYYGGVSKGWSEMQWGGVLQRIAACYLLAASIYIIVRGRPRAIIAACVVLLAGYWAVLALAPFPDLVLEKKNVEAIAKQVGSSDPADIAAAVPGRVRGVYEEGRNLTNYVDFRLLPGKKPQAYYINEGLLSTFPAVALPLIGALAGQLLKDRRKAGARKVIVLLGVGAGLTVLGLLWGLEFPLIKRIWTSSFVVLTAGLSTMLLAVFYLVVDVGRVRKPVMPLVWIGTNAIVLYMAWQIVKPLELAGRLVGGDVGRWLDTHVAAGVGGLVTALTAVALVVVLARFMFKRGVFVRV